MSTKYIPYIILIQISCASLVKAHDISGQSLSKIEIATVIGKNTLSNLLMSVQKQSEIVFSFDANALSKVLKKKVNLKKNQFTLQELLELLSKEYRLSFRRLGNTISMRYVSRKEPINPVEVLGDSVLVKGKILDGNGEGLPGANIVVFEQNRGTVSDVDGTFELQARINDILVVSYVGYFTKEIVVNNDDFVSIEMESDLATLSEIVVVGYGVQRKSDLTGAVSSVKSEELQKIPNADPASALQGKIPGLQVLSSSGNPGSAPVLRLRGITTLNNNNPIFVVDGVILQDTDNATLDFLNVNDIESVEVLKDASATAIFGSRGSNGVVIISTKKGKQGPVKVNLSAQQGFESVENQIGLMNGQEFATYSNEIIPGSYNNINALPNTDWQNEVFRDFTPITNFSGSISGASEKLNYYASSGYYAQRGVIPKSGLERYTGKINTTYSISKDVTLGVSLSAVSKDKKNAPGAVISRDADGGVEGAAGVISPVYSARPIDNVRNRDGSFGEVVGGVNPVASIEFNDSNTKSRRAIGNVYGEFRFLRNFSFKSSYQFDYIHSKTRSFIPSYFVSALQQAPMNSLAVTYFDSNLNLFENTISYNNDNADHRLSLLAGFTSQLTKTETLSSQVMDLISDVEELRFISGGDPAFIRSSNSGTQSAIQSLLFRANYSLFSKYLLTATFRRDGSSKFGETNRWGNFPSLAIGWNVSSEDFFPKTMLMDHLKLRASWGIVGNEKIPGERQYSRIISGRGAVFGESETYNNGATFNGSGNGQLKWEESRQFNLGLDFGMFNSRLNGELDYYVKNTSDILVSLPLLGVTGIGFTQTVTFNAASVKNSGVELGLTWSDDFGNVNYKLGVTGSWLRNEVTDLGEEFGADSVIIGGDLPVGGYQLSRTIVGEPIGFFYGFQVQGIYQNEEQLSQFPSFGGQGVGDFIYRDINGDGVIDTRDRTKIGNSIPDYVLGINASFSYRNISLNVDFQGQLGNDIFNAKKILRTTEQNYESSFLDRWTGEGSTNSDPRASSGGVNFNASDYFVENGSFIRLRSVVVSYNFQQDWMERNGLDNARIFISGTNLVTWTDFSGYSPDIGSADALAGVIDQGVYPITRIYNIGLNVSF